MARMVDVDALKAIRFHDLPYSQIVPAYCDTEEEVYAYKLGWNDAIDAIVESAPTVDAVPVVRCKDCKYSRPKKSGIKLHCAWWYRSVYDDDFCSSGKRRNDGT